MPRGQRGLGGVEMANLSIRRATEDADGRLLPTAVFFHQKVTVECIVVTGYQADLVPSAVTCPLTDFADFYFGHEHKVYFVAHVRCDGIVAVRPHIAHGALE